MNYLTKYRIEFASIAGVQWKIDIQEDAFEGSITNLTATGNPLKIAFDSDADTFNDPVKSSKAVFNVYSLTDFQLVDLYSNYDFRFRILIYKDDTLYWQGFIITGEYSEPYNCPPYPVQITAIDGLSHLKNILYVQSQTISIGTETLVYYEGRKSESQILFDILSKIQITGFREYVNIFEHQMPAQTIDDSPFDQVIIDVDVFRDFYCWDVLVEIVKKYNAIIRQANGEIIIYRPIELTQSVVYGRIFTAFDTKTSTSFVPDQYINRAAIPSGWKQFPGSVKMVKRPVRKITINQDYGYKKSFLDNWEMKGNTLSGSGVVWNLQSWGKTNTFLIQPATICGEPDGVVLVDHNEYPTLNKYLFQSFGTYLEATSDIHFFEFDYMIWNGKGSAGADIVFYVELSADDASNYLIGDGTDSTQWQESLGRMDITYPSPIQSDGWHTFKRSVPGLPVDGPYSVSLYATDHAEPLIFVAFKNIRFYATSDSIVIKRPKYKTLLLKIIAFGQRPKSYQVVKDNAEIVQKEYILENRYNNIPINGIELLEEYLLGDVVDSNVENVVEQFQGALAVGTPDSYTGAIDKVDTATFHPTAGSGTVSCNGYSESIVWNTSVSQTLDDFMAAHSGDFGTVVLVKTSGSTITFTGSFDFVSASISASFGTAVNTTPYYIGDAIYTLSPTEQWNSLNPGLEARPLLEIIAGETAFQYSRPKELIQMMIHDDNVPILTIIADNKTKVYGSANPALTITYYGFIDGDDYTDLDTPPDISTTVDASTDAGTYAGIIEVSGAASTKYQINYINGNFIVTQKELSITLIPISKKYDGNTTAETYAYLTSPGTELIGSDVVTVSTNSGVFDNATLGTDHTVTANVILTGADGANYYCDSPVSAIDGVICNLRMEIHPQNKVYNGSPGLTVTLAHWTTEDAIYGTNMTTHSSLGQFIDKYIGNGKVCWAAVGVDGADAANYVCANWAKSTANIT